MIVGVDQIILDLIVDVDTDDGIFDRYGIERNTQCLAEAKHQPLLDDLKARAFDNDKGLALVRATPGGIVCNSLRSAAWYLRRQTSGGPLAKPALKMIGMVGRDTAAECVREKVAAAGVEPLFDVKPNVGPSSDSLASTGVCCCLVKAKERTMVAELGAGKTLELHGNLEPTWPGWVNRMEKFAVSAGQPIIVVTSAFYVSADPEGTVAMQKWCGRRLADGPQPIFALGISAEWCCNLPVVQDVARSADFLFANEPEVLALAAALRRCGAISNELPEGDSDAAVVAVAGWKERGWVIVTRGSKSIAVLRAHGTQVQHVPVPSIDPAEVVDDVGAGDSFMGGFLADVWQRLDASSRRERGEAAVAASRERDVSRSPRRSSGDSSQSGGVDELNGSDIEIAARAGTVVAAACLRCFGCQHAD